MGAWLSRCATFGVLGLVLGLAWLAAGAGRLPTLPPGAKGGDPGALARHLDGCPRCSAPGSRPAACPGLRALANGRLGWRIRPDSLLTPTPPPVAPGPGSGTAGSRPG